MELVGPPATMETLQSQNDNEMVEIVCSETINEPEMEVSQPETLLVNQTSSAVDSEAPTGSSQPQLTTSETLQPELTTPEPNNVVEITQNDNQGQPPTVGERESQQPQQQTDVSSASNGKFSNLVDSNKVMAVFWSTSWPATVRAGGNEFESGT